MLPPYERYAEIYDRIGQRRFGESIAAAVLAELERAHVEIASVADLACGTGAAALRFAAAGLQLIGVDRSPQMLGRARLASERLGLPVEWLLQDLQHLALPRSVDLATCFYDSLNYILDGEDLQAIFAHVAGSLNPGGQFVFDLNSRRRLAEGWADPLMIAADEEDLLVLYRSWWDEAAEQSPLRLTAFLRQENGVWDRFDEEHIERAYGIDQVKAMLEATGFPAVTVREFHSWNGKLGGQATESTDRLVFFASVPP